MAEQSSQRRRVAPPKEYRLVEITDPVEFAARVDRMRNAIRVVEVEATPDGVLELYKGLPADARLKALRLLVRKLSADEKQELLARLQPKTAQPAQAQRPKRNGKK
jgi:hypothetical protein